MDIKNIIINFLKNNKQYVYGYLFFSFMTPLSNIYLPHLYGKIISSINKQKKITQSIKIQFYKIFFMWIILQFFWYGLNTLDSKFVPKLRSHIRQHVVQKILESYKQDYFEDELGGLLSEIVRVPDEIEHLFNNIRNHILPVIYIFVFGISYFTWINPILGLSAFLFSIIYIYAVIKYSKKCKAYLEKTNNNSVYLHNEINECIENLLNIYSSNKEKDEIKYLNRKEEEFINNDGKSMRCTGSVAVGLNILYIVFFLTINMLSFYLLSKESIKLENVITVLIVSMELMSKMCMSLDKFKHITHEVSVIQHIQKLINKLNKRQQINKGYLKPDLKGNIIFDNVIVKKRNIKEINLYIPNKSNTLIIGEIGSGKTTILNCIMRLIPIIKGKVIINGYDIKDIDLDYLRTRIIYIPQITRLFNKTIYENITYGCSDHITKDMIKQTLSNYGIQLKLDQNVGKFGKYLSGGQGKIIDILRCLFRDADIVLLDEPTASLSSNTKKIIINILKDILDKKTVIITSHDPELLNLSNNIISLH